MRSAFVNRLRPSARSVVVCLRASRSRASAGCCRIPSRPHTYRPVTAFVLLAPISQVSCRTYYHASPGRSSSFRISLSIARVLSSHSSRLFARYARQLGLLGLFETSPSSFRIPLSPAAGDVVMASRFVVSRRSAKVVVVRIVMPRQACRPPSGYLCQ